MNGIEALTRKLARVGQRNEESGDEELVGDRIEYRAQERLLSRHSARYLTIQLNEDIETKRSYEISEAGNNEHSEGRRRCAFHHCYTYARR